MDAGRVCPKALCKDAYKWSNIVGAGRTDNKRPRLHRCRANKAYTALHHGEGVWGFGKDAEIERPKALQDAKLTKRSYRDREQALFWKNRLFLQSEGFVFQSPFAMQKTHKNNRSPKTAVIIIIRFILLRSYRL
ncbi:hypothetical protein EUBSIR_01745 [[Eubacterium] siraeum DSM 15702]|uniref:Uncharacterized protein n=1 Tax=[Eubacterium] siraeum DSM 15702 TaxID=428128 RepID=B0MPI6_9FIRM|nr:hypothetical protein EUBSIR_01745 [[Eubacterium] siraeum DSM 15702]